MPGAAGRADDPERNVGLDREVRYRIYQEGAQGLVDARGVQPLANWVEDGNIYCVMHAPDEDAFRLHHADRDLFSADVHPLRGLLGRRPLSPVEEQIVRSAIVALWHERAADHPGSSPWLLLPRRSGL